MPWRKWARRSRSSAPPARRESDPMYQAAHELAFRLAQSGFAIITGGGPGIMEAANRGAHEPAASRSAATSSCPGAGNQSLRRSARQLPLLLLPQDDVHEVLRRLRPFPGGYGTLDELFEALTLIQTREDSATSRSSCSASPYWQGLLDWMSEHLVAHRAVSLRGSRTVHGDRFDGGGVHQVIVETTGEDVWDKSAQQ